jgi:hypothetical protein
MTRKREKEIERIFRAYKANKRLYADRYAEMPNANAVAYDKPAVTADKSKNVVELSVIEYIARREELYKKIFIVEQTLWWYKLEDFGRDKFVKTLLINNNSWTYTENECRISRGTLARWKRDAMEVAERIAKDIGYKFTNS